MWIHTHTHLDKQITQKYNASGLIYRYNNNHNSMLCEYAHAVTYLSRWALPKFCCDFVHFSFQTVDSLGEMLSSCRHFSNHIIHQCFHVILDGAEMFAQRLSVNADLQPQWLQSGNWAVHVSPDAVTQITINKQRTLMQQVIIFHNKRK